MLLNRFCIVLIVFSVTACSSSKKSGGEQVVTVNIDFAGPPTIIYKTTKDYSKNVPVILSDDKTKIISYPAPADVFYKGKLAYPAKLINGYWLDNRGISANTAFTKYTYEEYSKLAARPEMTILFSSIIDNNPIKEMYNCGNRYRFKDEVSELNTEIKNKQLKKFIKIK